jgi:hypothetical protein
VRRYLGEGVSNDAERLLAEDEAENTLLTLNALLLSR